jgi:hypothetical protein
MDIVGVTYITIAVLEVKPPPANRQGVPVHEVIQWARTPTAQKVVDPQHIEGRAWGMYPGCSKILQI